MAIKKYYVTVDGASTTRWYKDAKCTIRHRENGPAIEYSNGDRVWYQNGQLHRIDGPAIEGMSRHKEWWQNGQLHRTDGPAVVFEDGVNHWYINDKKLSEAEFLAATQPVVEMTVADIEKLLGKRVKIVK